MRTNKAILVTTSCISILIGILLILFRLELVRGFIRSEASILDSQYLSESMYFVLPGIGLVIIGGAILLYRFILLTRKPERSTSTNEKEVVQIRKAKKKLAMCWFLCAGFLFLSLIVISGIQTDLEIIKSLWSWYLPSVIPTLSLIISVLVTDSISGETQNKEVDKFLFQCAIFLSLFYFVSLSQILIFQGLIEISQLWLGPLQGLVVGVLGAVFINRKKPGIEHVE